ncbi:hypothetical protein Hrd1104_02220 [Halorhabdus sp. CBA1104]|uniref:hypothetical protein n=1 Tax=unclassified Halorhabdus TaxID=2621901 RepID=UPI0012B3C82E|nr:MULTISPECIES: hypothetical protein [unclassified Halorhabdus]QGN06221.1 hypothetical protein Hrd1104_02220 [Halorhabdus sp. CBA1104]
MAEDKWSYVCSQTQYLYTLIIALFMALLLTLFALFFGEPGTMSYTIAIFDLVLVVVAFGITTLVYRKCLQREDVTVG